MRPHDPTTGKRACGTVEITFTERQTAKNRFRLRFRFPVGIITAESQFQYSLIAHGCAFLRQVAERDALFPQHLAVIRRGFAQDDRKQRGFSRAVWSNQTKPISPIQLKGDIGKQNATCERFGNGRKTEHEITGMREG